MFGKFILDGKKGEREREKEKLLALVQCRFEVFSGQYLISTNKTRTKNEVTTIVYDRLWSV